LLQAPAALAQAEVAQLALGEYRRQQRTGRPEPLQVTPQKPCRSRPAFRSAILVRLGFPRCRAPTAPVRDLVT
jgi:hypothetical protein